MVSNWQKIVIGTCITEPVAFLDAYMLRPSDFSPPLDQVWKIMDELHEKGNLSTTVLLETLRERGIMTTLGDGEDPARGDDYFWHLVGYNDQDAFTVARDNVLDNGVRNELVELMTVAILAARGGKNSHEVIDDLLDKIVKARRDTDADGGLIGSMLPDFNQRMMDQREGKRVLGWTPSIQGLAEITGTTEENDMILYPAEPGGGKTAFFIAEAIDHALNSEVVVTFQGENSRNWYFQKGLAHLTGINSHKIRNPKLLSEEDLNLLTEKEEKLRDMPWYIYRLRNTKDMMFKAKRAKIKHGTLSFLQVDQVNNLANKERGDNDTSKVQAVTYGLRNMAQELDVPILAAHQQNRGGQRYDRPTRARIWMAGEQAATIVIAPWEQEIADMDAKQFPGNVDRFGKLMPLDNRPVSVMRFVLIKNTSDAMGETKDYAWYKATSTFHPLEDNWRKAAQAGQQMAQSYSRSRTYTKDVQVKDNKDDEDKRHKQRYPYKDR